MKTIKCISCKNKCVRDDNRFDCEKCGAWLIDGNWFATRGHKIVILKEKKIASLSYCKKQKKFSASMNQITIDVPDDIYNNIKIIKFTIQSVDMETKIPTTDNSKIQYIMPGTQEITIIARGFK